MIDLYLKVIELKNVIRTGWAEVGINNPESVMDHVGGSLILAMLVNNDKGLNLDMKKVYEMIILKELNKVSELKENSVISNDVSSNNSVNELLSSLSNNSELLNTYNEYLNGDTKEAKFALMITKLESDIQAKKYELDGLFTIDNAKKDIENYPEDLKAQLTNIENASDGWLMYDRKYYDDLFLELSKDIQNVK